MSLAVVWRDKAPREEGEAPRTSAGPARLRPAGGTPNSLPQPHVLFRFVVYDVLRASSYSLRLAYTTEHC